MIFFSNFIFYHNLLPSTEIYDDCENNPCINGSCINRERTEQGVANYECICDENFSFDESSGSCEQNNLCEDNPCQNSGRCIWEGGDTYECDCLLAFEGDDCEIFVNPCDDTPCENGSTCSYNPDNIEYGFLCDCSTAPGWKGATCSEPITKVVNTYFWAPRTTACLDAEDGADTSSPYEAGPLTDQQHIDFVLPNFVASYFPSQVLYIKTICLPMAGDGSTPPGDNDVRQYGRYRRGFYKGFFI